MEINLDGNDRINFGWKPTKYFKKTKDKYYFHESEYCKALGFKFIPDDEIFKELNAVNELLYCAEGNYLNARKKDTM